MEQGVLLALGLLILADMLVSVRLSFGLCRGCPPALIRFDMA